MSYFYFIF